MVTVTTVGYGDRFPLTEGGRAVAVILMLVGIGLIGTLTATVASFFVAEHTDANKDLLQASHEDLGARLDEIDSRLPAWRPCSSVAPDPPDPPPAPAAPPQPPRPRPMLVRGGSQLATLTDLQLPRKIPETHPDPIHPSPPIPPIPP